MPLLEDISSEQDPVRAAEDGSAMGSSAGGFGRYLLSMSLLLVAMYCVPFYVVRRADFDEMGNTPYSLPLNSAFQIEGENADVVLFGDSTALHGIDPEQMSRELGTKVINLPNTGATLRVMDDLSLRRYLKGNRAPRLLVLYFAAWDMDYMHTELPIGTYEGREVLAHQGTAAEIFAYAQSHPADSLVFPFQFYLANSSWKAVIKRPYRYAGAEAARTQGHLSNPLSMPLSPQCSFPPMVTDNLRFDSVEALGARYRTEATKVLYYLAPVPDCENASAVVDRSYSALPAAPPRKLPREIFSGSALYLHARPTSVPLVTEELVEAVRPLLANSRP